MSKERRRFKRFDAYMSVKCAVPSNENAKNYTVGLTRDLSRDGICLSTSQPLPSGSTLNIEIDIPDDPRPICTTGKVMWTKNGNADEGSNHGIRFVNIDPIDKFRVLDYAYNHWLETKVNDYADPEQVSELG